MSSTAPGNASGQIPTQEQIQTLPFLAGLSNDEIAQLILHDSRVINIPQGGEIARQGDDAEHVFQVLQGSVRLVRRRPNPKGEMVEVLNRIVGAGYLVGRYALLYNLQYTSSARAETDVLVLCVRTAALERLLYRHPEVRTELARQDIINRLRTMPIFSRIGLITLSYLSDEIEISNVQPEQVIYDQNAPADHLYLIYRGQITLTHPRHPDEQLYLGTGAPFGFAGALGGEGSQRDVYGHWATATARTVLYKLPWERIEQTARRFPWVKDGTILTRPRQTIEKVSVFRDFSPEMRNKVAGYCSFSNIPQHHLIMQQGDIGDSLWILLEGSRAVLSALKNNRALPRTPIDGVVYFGETALIEARNVESTVEAEPGSLWLRLHWQDFQRMQQIEGVDLAAMLNVHRPRIPNTTKRYRDKQYDWLATGEYINVLRRRHWIALVAKLRFAAIALGIGLALFIIAFLAEVGTGWALGVGTALLFPALAWGVLDYLNDFFILTNQRVIQQEKVILTSEYRREALLEQIQTVNVESSFWGNLLGYGTVTVFTAGTSGAILFDLVPAPEELRDEIFNEASLRRLRFRAESKLEIQNSLEDRLGLKLDLPSRVRAQSVQRLSDLEPGLSWWRRVWDEMTIDSQMRWSSLENVVWHKHWFVVARQVVPLALLLLVVLVGMVGGLTFFDSFQAVESLVETTLISLELILAVVALILLGAIAWIVADWWNDTYEVTRDRIIDIEKLPLFLSEERREAQLSDIQDIELVIKSPLEMLLNYGDVIVQTAAATGAFTFDHVPNPRAVKEEINRRLIEWRREDERRKAREQMRDLPDWFELYNRLEPGQVPSRQIADDVPD